MFILVAILSVSNKEGLISLARCLHEVAKLTLIASGGTAKSLKDAGIPVK